MNSVNSHTSSRGECLPLGRKQRRKSLELAERGGGREIPVKNFADSRNLIERAEFDRAVS